MLHREEYHPEGMLPNRKKCRGTGGRLGRMIGWAARLGILFFAVLPIARAQLTTGAISGTVKDSTGAVAPGVEITVRNVETGISRAVQTDSAGHYLVSNLAPGSYEVQAELTGFQTEVRRGITLTLGREAVVDLTLRVGQVQEQVVVTGEAPLVDTSSAALTGLVEQHQVTDLPLNGRNLAQLTALQPGVLNYRASGGNTTTGGGYEIVIAGARTRQLNFLLNGTSIINFFGKSPGGVSGYQMGAEGIREFTVLTSSYSAEFGHSAGGVVNAITKSGTNTLHGSVFEYLRNDNLDAPKWEENALGKGEKAEFKRNQFGASLGGPIRQDKTFFFISTEYLRERLGQTLTRTYPTADARQGNIPGRPTFTVAPEIKPYLDLAPLPNGQDLGDGTGRYSTTFSKPTGQNYGNVRLDHRFSDSDSLYGSYVVDDSEQTTAGPVATITTVNPWRSQYVSLEETHIFSPTLLNTAHFGFNRSKTNGIPTCTPETEQLNFTGIAGACPRFQNAGFTVPNADFGPKIRYLNSFQYWDTLAWMRGGHTFKFGGYFERLRINGESPTNPGGLYSARGSLESWLQADMQFFEGPIPGGDLWRGFRENLFAFFANDDVRLRPNLTVNLGVRYEFITPVTEVNGKLANLPTLTSPTVRVGEPYFENPSLLNFSPRVGIGWSPGTSRNTSIRAGFGIFYDQILYTQWSEGPFRIPPFYSEGRVTPRSGQRLPFPNVYPAILAGQFTQQPSFMFTIDGNPPQPYMLQYNLTVQRQLPKEIMVQAAYVGSGGRNLPRLVDNTAYSTLSSDGRIFFPPTSVRRNPNFAEIRMKVYDTTSSYHSLQLAARRRFAQGVGFQVSYTWSKMIDMLSATTGTGDIFNDTVFGLLAEFPQLDKGRSSFDARHNFAANFSADLPFAKNLTGVAGKILGGWRAQGIASLQTGLPTAVLLGFDNARMQSTRNQQRPTLNPGFNSENTVLGPPNRTKDPLGRYLDPKAFSLPETGYLGNLGRNVFSGPGLATFDVSLLKNISLTEKMNLEFRSEFFNLFNRPNFDYPSQTVFNRAGQTAPVGNFSTITGTRTTGRQVQFALKLTF